MTKGVSRMIRREDVQAIAMWKRRGLSKTQTALRTRLNWRTVSRYWDVPVDYVPTPARRERTRLLEPHRVVIEALFRQHRNCDVVRQEMQRMGIPAVAARTLQLFVQDLRRQLRAADQALAKASQRIETAPGEYLQIDFGSSNCLINGKKERVHLFVGTLAYSRRIFARASWGETQQEWIEGLHQALVWFHGSTTYLVCDNAKALVKTAARRGSRHCVLNDNFEAYCQAMHIEVIACLPHYPQSKGKVERAVGYVKHNAIAGRQFASLAELNTHLRRWQVEVADQRVMEVGEPPRQMVPWQRFQEEKQHLRPLPLHLAEHSNQEMWRKVDAKGLIQVGKKSYLLGVRYAKLDVRIEQLGNYLKVFYGKKLLRTMDCTLDMYKHSTIPIVPRGTRPVFGAAPGMLSHHLPVKAGNSAMWPSEFVTAARLRSYDSISNYREASNVEE